MKSQEIKITKTVITKETFNLTSDDIEELLRTHPHFKFKGSNIQFNWNIGQWVSLTVIKESKEEDITCMVTQPDCESTK